MAKTLDQIRLIEFVRQPGNQASFLARYFATILGVPGLERHLRAGSRVLFSRNDRAQRPRGPIRADVHAAESSEAL